MSFAVRVFSMYNIVANDINSYIRPSATKPVPIVAAGAVRTYGVSSVCAGGALKYSYSESCGIQNYISAVRTF